MAINPIIAVIRLIISSGFKLDFFYFFYAYAFNMFENDVISYRHKKSPPMWAMIRYKILHINVVAIHRIQVVLGQVVFYLVDCSCVVD